MAPTLWFIRTVRKACTNTPRSLASIIQSWVHIRTAAAMFSWETFICASVCSHLCIILLHSTPQRCCNTSAVICRSARKPRRMWVAHSSGISLRGSKYPNMMVGGCRIWTLWGRFDLLSIGLVALCKDQVRNLGAQTTALQGPEYSAG